MEIPAGTDLVLQIPPLAIDFLIDNGGKEEGVQICIYQWNRSTSRNKNADGFHFFSKGHCL